VFSQATFALCPESDPQKGFPFNKSPQVQSPVLCCSVKLPPFCLRSELRPWSPAGGRQGNKNAQHSNRAHFHKPKLLPKSPHRQGALPLQKTSLNPRLSSQAKNNPRVTTETHLVSCDEHHVFSQATFGISSSHHGNTSGWLRRAPRVFPSDLWKVLRPQTIPEPSSTLQKGNTPQQHEVSFQNPDSFPRVQSLCRFSQRLPKVG